MLLKTLSLAASVPLAETPPEAREHLRIPIYNKRPIKLATVQYSPAPMISRLRGGSGPGDVTAPAINNLVMYAIVCALGTPPEPVNLLFDTGSGILWVKPDKYKTADSSMHKDLAPGIFTITNGCDKKNGRLRLRQANTKRTSRIRFVPMTMENLVEAKINDFNKMDDGDRGVRNGEVVMGGWDADRYWALTVDEVVYSDATLKGSLDVNTLADTDTDTTLILLEQTIFVDLEINGELGLNKPEFTTTDDWMPLLKRIPDIHSLEVGPLIEVRGLLAAVPELFPKVCSLEINDYDYDCDIGTLERLIGSARFAEWSFLTRQLFTADQVRIPRAALSKHSSVLTSLITEDMDMDEFLVVVAICPALRVLNVEYLRVCGSELEVPAWGCTELRELSFAFQYGPDADGSSGTDAETLERQELAARRVASLFKRQLGGHVGS
ncbi:hypothetical protein BG000_000877 [Podila horticola]|nr:hypothetical protein BG000_000877 [Podila horticola]